MRFTRIPGVVLAAAVLALGSGCSGKPDESSQQPPEQAAPKPETAAKEAPVFNRPPVAAEAKTQTFKQVGYKKDKSGDRVYTVSFLPPVTEEDVRAYGATLKHESGRMVRAYFFPDAANIPGFELTRMKSVSEVEGFLMRNEKVAPWHFVLTRKGDGKESVIVACSGEPQTLCRKS